MGKRREARDEESSGVEAAWESAETRGELHARNCGSTGCEARGTTCIDLRD